MDGRAMMSESERVSGGAREVFERHQAIIDHREALRLQQVRNHFFRSVAEIVTGADSNERVE